jgi:molybdopterin synthase sulfur carrier subunit
MRLKVLYFAWVRERIGRAEELIDVPAEVATVADLQRFLAARGPEYGHAFERADVIRAAIDQTHVKPTARLEGASEVAFFPPVTGG